LRYLYKNKNDRFNLRAYSKITNIPRSTIYDYVNKLDNLGFIKKETANNQITEKGIIVLKSEEGMSDMGVGRLGRECRKKANLSTHYHKFKLPISNKENFRIENIDNLNPIDYNENKLHNLYQIIINFEDATILINPKQLIINLYDIHTKDVDESDFKCLSRAIEYAKKFIGIGIITEGMIIEEGHWARVESKLSDFLHDKVDNKYFLDLGQGKKFWIDHSLKREDETNDKEIRERIDTFLTDVINSNAVMSDINLVVKALGFISKLESARLFKEIDQRKELTKHISKEKPDYFG